MWTLHRGPREVVCQLSTHPFGWELRASVDGDDFLRSQVCRRDVDVFDTAAAWRAAAEAKGWKDWQQLTDPGDTTDEHTKADLVTALIAAGALTVAEIAHAIKPHAHEHREYRHAGLQLGYEEVMTSAPTSVQEFPAARRARKPGEP